MLKGLKLDLRAHYLLWGLLMVSILLAQTPLMWAGILLSLAIWSIYFPYPALFSSFVSRIIVSFLVIACLQQLFGIVFWLLDLKLTVPWVILLQALAILTVSIITEPRKERLRPINSVDFVSLLIAIFSVAIIFFGTLRGGPIGQQLLRYLTVGFDNTTHVSLTLTTYQNQGFVYGPSEEVTDEIVYKDFTVYPQGWHLNNSILLRSVFQNGIDVTKDFTKLLFSYFVIELIWYGIIIFLFCKIILELVRKTTADQLGILQLMLAPTLTVLAQIIVILGILRAGFGSFLPQLAYTLLLILLTASYLLNKRDAKKVGPSSYLALGLLICAGMSFSWLLAAPIGYLMVFMGSIVLFDGSLRELIKWLFSNLPRLAFFILLISLPAVQGVIQILYSEKSNQLNEDGGIGQFNNLLVFTCLVICLAFFIYGKFKDWSALFITSITGAMVLSGTIYLYQYMTASKVSYYSIKVGFIPFIILLMFTSVIIIKYSESLSRSIGAIGFMFFLLGSSLFILQASNTDLRIINYAKGSYRLLSPYSASQINEAIDRDGADKANIVVFKELDYEEDLITTHFLKMLSRDDPECQRLIIWYLLSRQREMLTSQIPRCAQDKPYPFYVIGSSKNYSELENLYKSKDMNIKVLLSN